MSKSISSSIINELLNEEASELSPRFDSAKSFYGKARTETGDDGSIVLISYSTPILKVKDGKLYLLCDEDALSQTTLRHCRDFIRQMDADNKLELSGKDYPITKKWILNLDREETLEEAKVLKEAPEDEEFEVVDEEIPEEPTEEIPEESDEMTTDEVEDEAQEDAEETIQDEIEQPFYATTPEFDELRDILPDLDYRLFLINDNMVCIGRLNGPDIEFLTSNNTAVDNDITRSDANEDAEEVEERAEEDGEDSFEYLWIKAPDTLDKFLAQVNVVYLSPEMTDEEKEQYAGIEASHESVMNYLMNQLPEDKRNELESEEVEEEIPEEIPEEPTEEPTEEPMEDEEPIEDEEEEE